jgi:hypothetical protein
MVTTIYSPERVFNRREKTRGVGDGTFDERERSDLLPKTVSSDYRLLSVQPRQSSRDPYVLYNKFGQILHEWPEDYIPDWLDVLNVCKELKIA